MLALQGYYDGSSVKTLEKINAKKNQKVIITVLDEFIDEIPRNNGVQQEVHCLSMLMQIYGKKKMVLVTIENQLI